MDPEAVQLQFLRSAHVEFSPFSFNSDYPGFNSLIYILVKSSDRLSVTALYSERPCSDDVLLRNTAQVSWAHQALKVPSKARCDWSSSNGNKTSTSGESQVEQPAEAFSCFKAEKQETQKSGSFKEGWGGGLCLSGVLT